MSLLPKLFCLSLLLLSWFALPDDLWAAYYFDEEFNEERAIGMLNSDKWTVYPNQRCSSWPNIKESAGFVKLSQCTYTNQFPFIVSRVNPFPAGNWSSEISFQYTKVTPWGTGIVLAEEAPANGTNPSPLLDLSVWQDKTLANLRIGFDHTNVYTTPINTNLHALRVDRSGQKYLIYLDNSLVFTSADSDKLVKVIWMGNSTLQNPVIPEWTEFKVDYVRVGEMIPTVPVVFIPGIGGSEFKASQDIVWSKDDGHGGTYSHAYSGGEKIWVNQSEAIKLGEDDYFDVLKLQSDGQTSEADLSLTGNLTPFGYPDIESFFEGLKYVKGKTFFIFPYDWRKDIATTRDSLNSLIEQAKSASGQDKVDIVAHSMGGLVARYYISDPTKASKVNKLISMGVPHLGAVKSLKTLMYGTWLAKDFYLFKLGIVPSEVRDVFQNLPSGFELLPSSLFFSFYDNSDSLKPYPFYDDRDIDNNKETGALNFAQTKTLLNNLSYNMTTFNIAEQFHGLFDSKLTGANNVKLYHIVGSAQPTLGQIKETWWINWPIKLLPRYDEIYVNGDGTVPLYSAALASDKKDFSAGAKIYYVEQEHTDLINSASPAMQLVKNILAELNTIPTDVKNEKVSLEGDQLSVDQDSNLDLYDENGNHTGLDSNGEVENKISNTFFDTLGDTKHAFIKKSSKKITAKVTSSKKIKTNIKLRHYSSDQVSKTIFYKDVPVDNKSSAQLTIDQGSTTSPVITVDSGTIPPTSKVDGAAALDSTPPVTAITIDGTKDSSGNYLGSVTITLTGSDLGSGILKIEYSLDNGQTVRTYTGPFTISTPGSYSLQVKATDKLGNEESPQTINFTIGSSTSSVTNTPTPTPTQSSQNTAESTLTPTVTITPTVTLTPTSAPVLVASFKKASETLANTPGVGSDSPSVNVNETPILGAKTTGEIKLLYPKLDQTFSSFLFVSALMAILPSLGLTTMMLDQFSFRLTSYRRWLWPGD